MHEPSSSEPQDAQGRSAIWHAAAAGHAPCVERLLLYSPHHRANPNMADLQRVTPLMASGDATTPPRLNLRCSHDQLGAACWSAPAIPPPSQLLFGSHQTALTP